MVNILYLYTISVGITLTTCRIHILQWYVLCGVISGLLIL
jgi:hypothetical protein